MIAPPRLLVAAITRAAGALAKLRRRLLPPHFAAADLGTASWVALGVAAFCELGLPQALESGPLTCAELAARGCGGEDALYRLLRALSAYDVVEPRSGGRFALAHAGRGLTGANSAAPLLAYANAPWHLQAYAQLARGIRTGTPGFDLAHGSGLFPYLQQHADAGAIFDAAMQALVPLCAQAFAAAYPFPRGAQIVDVGGGTGLLLKTLLDRSRGARGTIYELPAVAARAREFVAQSGCESRIAVVEGDVLQQPPPSAEYYVLSHVLHDWDDRTCARMLRNVRRAMGSRSRVLVHEIVAQPPNARWSQDRLSDLEMLAMLRGRERTAPEYAALLRSGGLRLTRIVPTAAAESVIEAAPLAGDQI